MPSSSSSIIITTTIIIIHLTIITDYVDADKMAFEPSAIDYRGTNLIQTVCCNYHCLRQKNNLSYLDADIHTEFPNPLLDDHTHTKPGLFVTRGRKPVTSLVVFGFLIQSYSTMYLLLNIFYRIKRSYF